MNADERRTRNLPQPRVEVRLTPKGFAYAQVIALERALPLNSPGADWAAIRAAAQNLLHVAGQQEKR